MWISILFFCDVIFSNVGKQLHLLTKAFTPYLTLAEMGGRVQRGYSSN